MGSINRMFHSRVSIAPMMDWTDRFYRYFIRQITQRALLYTEMIHADAIVKGRRYDLLEYDAIEHPLAVQFGGSDPNTLAAAAKIAEDLGYDEINLNVGCPSDRVQSGRFGACLMAEPVLVGECISAMQARVSIPVTVKCRIGIDKQDHYSDLHHFVQIVQAAGCQVFIIHARAAWLKGLSPKENREIPPLKYDHVYQLKKDFSALCIILNGGVKTSKEVSMHLKQVDGVMIGRQAYHDPYSLITIDRDFYEDDHPCLSREEIVEKIKGFIASHVQEGGKAWHVARHMLGLYHGQPGARLWRSSGCQGL